MGKTTLKKAIAYSESPIPGAFHGTLTLKPSPCGIANKVEVGVRLCREECAVVVTMQRDVEHAWVRVERVLKIKEFLR